MKKAITIFCLIAVVLLTSVVIGVQNNVDKIKNEDVFETSRELLDESEKKAYDEIVEAISEMDSDVELSEKEVSNDRDRLDKVFTAIELDHPELFWYEGYRIRGLKKIISISYIYTEDEVAQKQRMLDEIYEPIVSIASELNSPFEKVEFVKETIQGPAYLNIEQFGEIKVLMKGFDREFKYVMDLLGIKSLVNEVYTGRDYEYYNFVYVDNYWYNINIPFTPQNGTPNPEIEPEEVQNEEKPQVEEKEELEQAEEEHEQQEAQKKEKTENTVANEVSQ